MLASLRRLLFPLLRKRASITISMKKVIPIITPWTIDTVASGTLLVESDPEVDGGEVGSFDVNADVLGVLED